MATLPNIQYLLQSLSPRNEEEVHTLQTALACAEFYGVNSPLGMHMTGRNGLVASQATLPGGFPEFRKFLDSVPEDAARLFHGLVDALGVYRDIHGRGFAIDQVRQNQDALAELRQIRDLCLDEMRAAG